MLKNVSTKAIFTLFKLLVFFTPIIFVANTHELFEFPKMYFVYAVGTTIIWIFLIKKISLEESFKLPNTSILLFVLAYVLSTIFSSHHHTSIWGYYSRFNGSLMSVLLFFGLYIVLLNEFTKRQIRNLVLIGAYSMIPIGLYAVVQHYGFVPNVWKAETFHRAFSTFGQPNWLAAYAVMVLPISLWQLLKEKENIKLWIAIYALSFASIWFAQSMAGILALVLSIVLFAIIHKEKIFKQKVLFSALMLGSLLLVVLDPGIFREKAQDAFMDFRNMFTVSAQETETPKDSHNISDPGYIRQYLWLGTIKLIFASTENVLVGTGPETFPYDFQYFRPPELNYSSEWNFVFNKPHNYYLELLANIGFVGLITYLLLLKKILKNNKSFYHVPMVAFLIVNFFGWPTVATTLLFWIFLAGEEKKE